jgi:hypothetical protein
MGMSLFKEEHNAHNHKQFDHEFDHEIANLNLDKHFLEANRIIYLENSNIETKNESDEDLVNINLNDIFNLSEVKSNKIIDSNNVTERTLTESNICNFSKENQNSQTIINSTEDTQSILVRKENFLDK